MRKGLAPWLLEAMEQYNLSPTSILCKELTGLTEALAFLRRGGNSKYAYQIHGAITTENILIRQGKFVLSGFENLQTGQDEDPSFRKAGDVVLLGSVFMATAARMMEICHDGDWSEGNVPADYEITGLMDPGRILSRWHAYMTLCHLRKRNAANGPSVKDWGSMHAVLEVIARMMVEPQRRWSAEIVHIWLRVKTAGGSAR
ncbi:MAG: hypothetical protein M1837_006416 [Sclerophora amabilis]|nr:MAG: hypothetical protein M1837_006416 [Sclerophora amabilis]